MVSSLLAARKQIISVQTRNVTANVTKLGAKMYNKAEMRLGMIIFNSRMVEMGHMEYEVKGDKRFLKLVSRPEEPGPYQDYYDYVKLKGQDGIYVD
jgi:hypothetical protein